MAQKGLVIFSVALPLLIVALLIRYAPTDVADGPVNFKVVTIQPKGKHVSKNLMMFADSLAKEFAGEITLELLGGPEVIGPFQQPEAVRAGQIDMALTSASFYSNMSPLSHVNMFSNLNHDQLLANGFYDAHESLHKGLGFAYLGEITFDVPFFMFTNFRVDSLKDFVGKKIRVFPAMTPFIRSLGAAPVLMGQHEIYSAMERGVVDGFVMNTAGFVKAQSWHEVTSYMIKPAFYRGGLILLVNPESWNRLSDDLQERIKDYKFREWDPDPEGGQWFLDYNNAETKLVEESGVEVIDLSPEHAREYLTRAYESAWRDIIEDEPINGPKLKKLLFDEALLFH